MNAPHVGAFFDMDRTLIRYVSANQYVQYAWRKRELRVRDIFTSVWANLKYKANLLEIDEVFAQGLAFLMAKSPDQVARECAEVFEGYIKPTIFSEGLAKVAWHRAQGHRIVVLSSNIDALVEPFCRHVGIEDYICTRLEVADGRYTGRAVDDLICYGPRKVDMATTFAREHGLDLAESYFYSDSITDLPMLSVVKSPVVVNPDVLLRRQARRRAWPVLEFQT